MAGKPVRDVSGFLKFFREMTIGRKVRLNNRYIIEQSPRDQPPPTVPYGVSHKLSANYYFSRDTRGSIEPNEVLAVNTKASSSPLLLGETGEDAVEETGDSTAVAVTKKPPKLPGTAYVPECKLNV